MVNFWQWLQFSPLGKNHMGVHAKSKSYKSQYSSFQTLATKSHLLSVKTIFIKIQIVTWKCAFTHYRSCEILSIEIFRKSQVLSNYGVNRRDFRAMISFDFWQSLSHIYLSAIFRRICLFHNLACSARKLFLCCIWNYFRTKHLS